MKEQIVVASPYNEEHISLFQEYEEKNNLPNTISNYLKKTKSMMSEVDYRQLEQERPEITRTLFLLQKDQIAAVVHLKGEKDRKVCQVTIDNNSQVKCQEKILEETEHYAFSTLGMEELVLLQEEGNHLPSNYFSNQGFENLGIESGMQVYMKSKNTEKSIIYQM